MIYFNTYVERLPVSCRQCVFQIGYHCIFNRINVQPDVALETVNEFCPLRSGSVMEWHDAREELPAESGNYLVTVYENRFNEGCLPTVKIARYNTQKKHWFRVTGSVTGWMDLPDVYRR